MPQPIQHEIPLTASVNTKAFGLFEQFRRWRKTWWWVGVLWIPASAYLGLRFSMGWTGFTVCLGLNLVSAAIGWWVAPKLIERI